MASNPYGALTPQEMETIGNVIREKAFAAAKEDDAPAFNTWGGLQVKWTGITAAASAPKKARVTRPKVAAEQPPSIDQPKTDAPDTAVPDAPADPKSRRGAR